MKDLFPTQPEDAALWIYTSDRSLNDGECQSILDALDRFLSGWTSHERAVVAEATFLFSRFLVVGAHIPGGDVSGCGIDKLVHAVESAGAGIGISWLSSLDVVFRAANREIRSASRPAFRRLVETSEVVAETGVFDTGLNTLAGLRAGDFEQPAANAWHGRIFGLAPSVHA